MSNNKHIEQFLFTINGYLWVFLNRHFANLVIVNFLQGKGDNKKFIIFFLIFLNVFYAIINICIVLFGIHNENDRFLLMMKTVLFFSANAHNFLCGRYFHKFL